jgi:hypothetical protein
MTDRFHPALTTALLIDGDNLSPDLAGTILHACGPVPTIRRVYADLTTRTGWAAVPGLRAIHAGQGKNAADLLLAIEAMDLVARGSATGFAIASSDGDFAHLAHRLREGGHPVIGIGEAKAPARFRAACTRFVELTPTSASTPPTACASPIASTPPQDHASNTVLGAVVQTLRAAGGSKPLAVLGGEVGRNGALRAAGIRDVRGWLAMHPGLFDLDPRGPAAKVRLKV